MSMYEKIKETLNNLDNDELVEVWNNYCDYNNYFDDRLEPMYCLDDDLAGLTPTEIIRLVTDNDFDLGCDYYKHTIYGIESVDDVVDYIYFDDLVDYIENNRDGLGNSELEDILDENDDDLED